MSVNRRTMLGGAAAAGLAGLAVARPAAADPGAARNRRYEDKVVLITGATFGIGRAAAKAFAAEGARVGFCGRTEAAGREVEHDIRKSGGQAMYVRADVRVPEQVQSFVDHLVARFGRLDVAVNNAGVYLGKPLHETSVEEWDNVQHTNARGAFLAIKYEVPHLIRAGGGVIICTASAQAGHTRPGNSAYTASKRAVQGVVRAAALDYGSKGIRVLSIDPGTTDTRLVRPPGVPRHLGKLQEGLGPAQRLRPAEDGPAGGDRHRHARPRLVRPQLPHR